MKKLIIIAIVCLTSVFSANAEATLYIFDNYKFANMDYVTFNGEKFNLPQKEYNGKYMGQMDQYKRAVTKITIKNEGPLIIAREMTWFQKPYHDEITFDIVDGETYYIELISGPKNKIKVLKEKDGVKALKKAEKDTKGWNVNEPMEYEN